MSKKEWEYKKLGDLSTEKMSYGTSAPSCEFNGEVRYIRITDINDDGYLNDEYVSPVTYEEKHVLQDGDIVFARTGATVGKAYCYHSSEEKYVYAGYLIRLRPNKNLVNSDYLYYCTKSNEYLEFIRTSQVAAAQPNVNAEKYSNFEIPLPPLEEQKRIVSILDRKFAQLETVKANAKTNLQNAKDLFQSQLTKAFSNTTWEKKRLGEVCLQKQNKRWKEESSNNEFQYIDLSAVDRNTNSVTETQTITKYSAPSRAQQIVKAGDVLFGTTRPTLKRVCLLSEEYDNQICSTGFCVIRANRRLVTPEWLFYQFFDEGFYKYIEPLQKGANYPAVTDSNVMDFEIPLPPFTEQKRIVEQLDSLSAKVRQLETIYTKQLADCDELKQAFLAKAFSGEL